jgi:hypothetical protein
MQENV